MEINTTKVKMTEGGWSIQKILKHLDKKYPTSTTTLLPPLRAPPNEQYGNDFTVQRDFNFGA